MLRSAPLDVCVDSFRRCGVEIGASGVKIQLNHEETWTKALKFMLTNLKWCLAWVCKQMS